MDSIFPFPIPTDVTMRRTVILNAVSLGVVVTHFEQIKFRVVVVDGYQHIVAHTQWVSSWEIIGAGLTFVDRPQNRPYTLTIEVRYVFFPRSLVYLRQGSIVTWSNPGTREALLSNLRALDSKIQRKVAKIKKERKPWRRVPRSTHASRPNPEQTDVYFQKFHQTGLSKTYTDRSYVGHYREIISQNTTDWFKKKRRRELPDNPCHVYISETKDSGIVWTMDDKSDPYNSRYYLDLLGDVYQSYFNAGSATVPAVGHNLADRNATIAKLAEKAGQSINNLAQDLVQFNQTVKMIELTVKRIYGSLLALRRRDYASAISNAWFPNNPRPYRNKPSDSRSFSKNLLELQYGWKPLLQDIIGFMESLARYHLANDSLLSVRTSKRKQLVNVEPLYSGVRVVGNRQILKTTTIQFCLRYKVNNALKAFLAQTGFTNPVNLFWEVLPYSFLFDWVLPVGQYLESLSAWDGLEFSGGYESRFTKQRTIISVNDQGLLDPPHSPPDGTIVTLAGLFENERVLFDRIPLGNFPSMKIPQLKNPFGSATHAANAIALLRTVGQGGPAWRR